MDRNNYEQRQDARRERYEERAAELRQEAQATYDRARKMASVIPFGQPILVGHHSEKRDRNYRERIHNTFGKSFALQDKAAHYEQKAASVGTGGISSDDPDAIDKLTEKLAELEKAHAMMVAANKAIRANKTDETRVAALVKIGFTEAAAAEAVKPDFCGRVGFPAYALSNSNANIRRVEGRIAELKRASERKDVQIERDGYTYREDTAENRAMFIFPGKPDEATRKLLRRHAFLWSPTRRAHVRKLNQAATWAAQSIMKELDSGSVR
jgi:prefoldin subunit 5